MDKNGYDTKYPALKVSTSPTPQGILQTRDVMGDVTHHFVQLCAKQMDDAIRARILELGWLPPEEAQKLRALAFGESEE